MRPRKAIRFLPPLLFSLTFIGSVCVGFGAEKQEQEAILKKSSERRVTIEGWDFSIQIPPKYTLANTRAGVLRFQDPKTSTIGRIMAQSEGPMDPKEAVEKEIKEWEGRHYSIDAQETERLGNGVVVSHFIRRKAWVSTYTAIFSWKGQIYRLEETSASPNASDAAALLQMIGSIKDVTAGHFTTLQLSPGRERNEKPLHWKKEATLETLGHAYSLGFSPDGKLLAVGLSQPYLTGWVGEVLLYTVGNWNSRLPFRGPLEESSIEHLVFSRDSRALYTFSFSGPPVRRWELPFGKVAWIAKEVHQRVSFNMGSRIMDVSRDGRYLAVAGFDLGVRLYKTDTGKGELFLPANPITQGSVAFSPDGKLFASGGKKEGVVWIYEPGTWKLKAPVLTGYHNVESLSFSQDGKYLAVGGVGECRVAVYSTESWKPVANLPVDSTSRVAFDPRGRYLAAHGLGGGVISLWSVDEWKSLGVLEIGHGATSPHCAELPTADNWLNYDYTYAVEFSPDGRYIAAAASQTLLIGAYSGRARKGEVHIWEVQ